MSTRCFGSCSLTCVTVFIHAWFSPSLQEHRSDHIHPVSWVSHHHLLLTLVQTSIARSSAVSFHKANPFICVPAGWAGLRHFLGRQSRRPWLTSQPLTTTLMKNTSATPASSPRTSYAVCSSKIPSKNFSDIMLKIKHHVLWKSTVLAWSFAHWWNILAFRKRMTIDDSLQHPWIKVCGLLIVYMV